MTNESADARLTPARDDVAASHLKGKIQAQRFVEGTLARVRTFSTALRRAPACDAPMDTQLLFGEDFIVYDQKDGWAWGQSGVDGYVGYAESMDLAQTELSQNTHRLRRLRSFVYAEPDIKSAVIATLGFNARACVTAEDNNFSLIDLGHDQKGHVLSEHLAGISEHQNALEAAQMFIGTPYLWGGRDGLGIDCSGLVQACLLANGIDCLRDTDMQEAHSGETVVGGISSVQTGDLVFWRGHVGMMSDAYTLLHANAFHMSVVAEPLQEAVMRIRKSGSEVTSVKRLAGLSF